MRWTRSRSLVVVLMLIVATLFSALALSDLAGESSATTYSDIDIRFDYPKFAAKSSKFQVNLTVSGGPAGDIGGNYTYKAEIVADNETGSSVSPTTATNQQGVFSFNVTMPGYAPQVVIIKLNITSREYKTREAVSVIREYRIDCVDPILIKATVYNRGPVAVSGAVAEFYADGVLLGSKTFDLGANASTVVQYNWTWREISDGKHTITVVLDDPNDLVEFSDGNNVLTLTIYVGEQSNPLGAVLTMLVIIMSVLVVLTFLQKPVRRKQQ